MKNDAVLSLLSLAAKAGKAVSGGYRTEETVKGGKAKLVVAAQDASEGSLKKIRDMCSYYEVPLLLYGVREDLGRSVGKELRTSVVLTDEGFARAVLRKAEGAGELSEKQKGAMDRYGKDQSI